VIEIFEQIKTLPTIPLDQITLIEVENEWKKFKSTKSIDSAGTSGYILKHFLKNT